MHEYDGTPLLLLALLSSSKELCSVNIDDSSSYELQVELRAEESRLRRSRSVMLVEAFEDVEIVRFPTEELEADGRLRGIPKWRRLGWLP